MALSDDIVEAVMQAIGFHKAYISVSVGFQWRAICACCGYEGHPLDFKIWKRRSAYKLLCAQCSSDTRATMLHEGWIMGRFVEGDAPR